MALKPCFFKLGFISSLLMHFDLLCLSGKQVFLFNGNWIRKFGQAVKLSISFTSERERKSLKTRPLCYLIWLGFIVD
jgi:hypothetical protein